MRILFLGDIVGPSGCEALRQNLENQMHLDKVKLKIKFKIQRRGRLI